MGDRKTGHEQFRNLFKPTGSREAVVGGSREAAREQTSVRVANNATPQLSRSRPSTNNNNSPFKNAKQKSPGAKLGVSSRSSKSMKKKKNSNERTKPSAKKNSGTRKKGSLNVQTASENSNRRGGNVSKGERAPRTPAAKTPPTTPGSRVRTPKKKKDSTTPPPPPKWNGLDVREPSQMCNTVFENDAGGGGPMIPTPGGGPASEGGEGGVKLAAAKIKERKLQWLKESLSPAKTDPRMQESSGGGSGENETEKAPSKEEIRKPHEANLTVKDRTIFENDDNHPALVKEEPRELKWAPGALNECMSEPAIRKKKSDDRAARGAVSERPPRDTPPIKPPRGIPAMVVRTPPQTPMRASPNCGTAHTPEARSPVARPVRLDPTAWTDQKTRANSTTGSTDNEGPASPAEKAVSCYLAPTMQAEQFNAADGGKKGGGQVDSEPYI